MLDRYQVILVIPRVIEIFICLICGYLLLNKDILKDRSKPGHTLKRTYFYVFISWALFTLMDLVANIIAPIGIPTDVTGTYAGYTLNFPALLIANILRDIYAVFGVLANYFTYRSIKIIQMGEEYGTKLSKRPFILFFYSSVIVSYAVIDIMTVQVDGGSLRVLPIWDAIAPQYVMLVVLVGYMFTFVFSFLVITKIYVQNFKTLKHYPKIQLLLFLLGYLFLLLGLSWFIFTPFLVKSVEQSLGPVTFQSIGHGFWILAPVWFYIALKMGPGKRKILSDGIEEA